mmetsp:Transcript_67051/g.178857  ORF Transcript_67051/g.178857 Transcript_67051/m.178857 type:complete len:399 (-) Transcript_67051:12-1208(-)
MQIVYALIIDNVFSHSALIEKDRATKQKVKVSRKLKQLNETFKLIDETEKGHPGFIQQRQLEQDVADPELRRRLKQMGVDLDELSEALEVMRRAGSTCQPQEAWNAGVVSVSELVYACNRVSEGQVWSKDVHAVLYDIVYAFGKIWERVGRMQDRFADLWHGRDKFVLPTKAELQEWQEKRAAVMTAMHENARRLKEQQSIIRRARARAEELKSQNKTIRARSADLNTRLLSAKAQLTALAEHGQPCSPELMTRIDEGLARYEVSLTVQVSSAPSDDTGVSADPPEADPTPPAAVGDGARAGSAGPAGAWGEVVPLSARQLELSVPEDGERASDADRPPAARDLRVMVHEEDRLVHRAKPAKGSRLHTTLGALRPSRPSEPSDDDTSWVDSSSEEWPT